MELGMVEAKVWRAARAVVMKAAREEAMTVARVVAKEAAMEVVREAAMEAAMASSERPAAGGDAETDRCSTAGRRARPSAASRGCVCAPGA